MPKKLLKFLDVFNYEKEEKSFVIAMILMAIFNFTIILSILNN